MPPDPTSTTPQTFINPQLPTSGFNFKLFMPIFLILLALLAGGAFLILKSRISPTTTQVDRSISLPEPSSEPENTVDSQANLVATTESIFTEPANQDINEYIKNAQDATTPEESYQNYVLAFNRMKEVYAETQDPQVQLAELQLKNYITASTEYQESDFTI